MGFLQIINKKKFTLISIFLFLYLALNLIAGERGLISYFEKKNVIINLSEKDNMLIKKLNFMSYLHQGILIQKHLLVTQ